MYLSYRLNYIFNKTKNYRWITGEVSNSGKYLVNEQGVAMPITYFKKFDHVYHEHKLSDKELNILLNNK